MLSGGMQGLLACLWETVYYISERFQNLSESCRICNWWKEECFFPLLHIQFRWNKLAIYDCWSGPDFFIYSVDHLCKLCKWYFYVRKVAKTFWLSLFGSDVTCSFLCSDVNKKCNSANISISSIYFCIYLSTVFWNSSSCLQLSEYELTVAADIVDPLILPITWKDIGGLRETIDEIKVG